MAFLELNKKMKPVSYTMANGEEYVFKHGERTQVSTDVAVGFLGANDYKITFSIEDKEALAGASDNTIALLKQEFGVLEGGRIELIKTMFPPTKVKKAVKAVKQTVVPSVQTQKKVVPKKTIAPSKVDKAEASSK